MVDSDASRRRLVGWSLGAVVSAIIWAAMIAGVMALRS
jgi:hypothetical protein